MSESFAALLEESLSDIELKSGSIVSATVVAINSDMVTVNAGLKSQSMIPVSQFYDVDGELEVEVGDTVEVAIESFENGYGNTILSRERAKRSEAWKELAVLHENSKVVMGIISGKVKGGFTVELGAIRAFLPGSLVDVRPIRDMSGMEGKKLEFKVIKLDEKRNNVVVSRRAVLEQETSAERSALLETLNEGDQVKGTVKNLTDYGAFVDLGGIDGLLHITDISWKRIRHPQEVLSVGQEVDVKILKYDHEKQRVSLGMKQLGDDPWTDLVNRYPVGNRLRGVVTNIADYGCFVELEDGVEGLVHVSEIDWTNKNIHPAKVVQLGDEVEVIVLEVNESKRRISLGIKQCVQNPWESFAENHNEGDKITGSIKSITDFGIFIGLDGGIDGLIHLSDISWAVPGDKAVREYKKGEEVETVILSMDPERERISLGIKQLTDDPFGRYIDANPKGTVVAGKVEEVGQKMAKIALADEVFGQLKAADISTEKVTDAREQLKEGDDIEAKIVNVDRKSRTILLSIRAKDGQDDYSSEKTRRQSPAPIPSATIGDLLKEKMNSNADDKKD